MNNQYLFKLLSSVAALGFGTAVISAVLYFMRLPIFDDRQVSWIFFYGLIAFVVAMVVIAIRGIWES